MNSIPDEILIHILNFLPFENAVKFVCISKKFKNAVLQNNWKTSNIHISQNERCEILLKYKLKINVIVIHRYRDNKITNIKIDGLKYKKLIFRYVDFLGIHKLSDMDSEISNTCKIISFSCCCNYSQSFIDSFDCLKKCVYIEFFGKMGTENDSKKILTILKNLPNLRKIYLMKWSLNSELLHLLVGYESVELFCATIADLEILHNCPKIMIRSCLINGQTRDMIIEKRN